MSKRKNLENVSIFEEEEKKYKSALTLCHRHQLVFDIKMKFCVLFSIIFGVAFGGYTKPGEITADNLESFATLNKITAGTALKKGQFLDFCYISVNFFQKQQTCGCFIYNEQFVATTARCVVE